MRRVPREPHRQVARRVLTIRDFSLHFGIPERTVETWIRIGRLNAGKGLLTVRGRTCIDLRAFESAFS